MPQSRLASYRIPKKYTRLNLNDMLFWDTVYYLFATRSYSISVRRTKVETHFSISNKEFIEYTGISRRKFDRLSGTVLDNQNPDDPYRIRIEKDSIGWNYIWIVTNYRKLISKHAIEKPLVLFDEKPENQDTPQPELGWIKALKYYPNTKKPTRIPWALLNRFFEKPRGSILSFTELKKFAQKTDGTKKEPDAAIIHQGLAHLMALGLVSKVSTESYRLNWQQFNEPARVTLQESGLSDNDPIIQQCIAEDPHRAARALELVRLGKFDDHFEEIFRDLQYVSTTTGYQLLTQKVKKHRNKPLGPDRWVTCWKQFNRDRSTESVLHQSPKVHLDLAKTTEATEIIELAELQPTAILWAKITLWLNTPNYPGYTLPSPIHVTLRLGKQILWRRDITDDNQVTRHDLSQAFRNATSHICNLTLTVETLLPRVSVDARLEARVWKGVGKHR